ncbi:hypothetical protein SGRIM128S_03479 [Streptomyces griseomycini]
MRVQALHVWPELDMTLATPTLTARARSALGRMTLADLPPSSRATRFTMPEAIAPMRRPTAVEPVKETRSTSGCSARAWPATGPRPVTRLNTPAGTPASCTASAKSRAVSGVSSAGLTTTVQPAARAGATLATIWWSG